MKEILESKKVLIGITGGIAAYKVNFLIRELKKMGADVRVIITGAGKEFVSVLTLETLSNNEVYSELFPKTGNKRIPHIELARWADCFLVCPATANFIAKSALGLADDLLSTVFISYNSKVIIAPSMNENMYLNKVVQENIKRLREGGHIIIEPEIGELACNEVGIGRLTSIEKIIDCIKKFLIYRDEFKGKKVLVTAGRTEEPIDPVRYISNYSTGKMGFSIAEEADLKGGEVTLISGPTFLKPSSNIKYIPVKTAEEMAEAVKKEFLKNDILIMTAAVSDYKPKRVSKSKIKKENERIQIELVKNEDILESIGKAKGNKITVGFSLETEDEISNSIKKLKKKNLDFIVVNNPLVDGAGFGKDTNVVKIIDKDENIESLPQMTKNELAIIILNKILKLINER